MSKETLKRGLLRAASAFLWGSASAFVAIPVDLTEPKRYIIALVVGSIAGGLMGLQKMISGYLKYDR